MCALTNAHHAYHAQMVVGSFRHVDGTDCQARASQEGEVDIRIIYNAKDQKRSEA